MSEPGEQAVLLEVADGVATITLNVPGRLNALSDEVHHALEAAIVSAGQDDSARVIVLTGAGRAFCAGADMTRLDRLSASRGEDYDIPRPWGPMPEGLAPLDFPPEFNSIYTFAMAMPKPVIAAVNGAAAGAGFLLAAFCDLRFASTTALFTAAFGARGLIAEAGLAWQLPRLVGAGHAADIVLSGRRVPADEALAMGLVNRVLEPEALMAFTLDYAREMAATVAPRSLRLMKQQLRNSAHQSFGESAVEAYDLLRESLAHDDFAEGIASFREKRPPEFPGR